MKFTVILALATFVATISVHGSVIDIEDTDITAEHVAENIGNNLDAHNLGKNLNADALSHVLSAGGDEHESGYPYRGHLGGVEEDSDRGEELLEEDEGEDDD